MSPRVWQVRAFRHCPATADSEIARLQCPDPTGGFGKSSQPDNTARNESQAGSRPHNLVLYYNYLVPDLPTSSAILSGLTHGWQVSGVSTFQSGTYGALTYAFTGAPQNDMTGGPG
jgi:hypothetical protein